MRPLAHGWRLDDESELDAATVRDFLRPAVRAVPRAVAARIGSCRIRVAARRRFTSRWRRTRGSLDIELARAEPHDLAMELLLCLGQTMWGDARGGEERAWRRLLAAEIGSGVTGEIDSDVLEAKRRALRRAAAPNLDRYVAAAFAATCAEYIHCLWHEVTVRQGPEYLAPEPLARRLRLMERLFPPDRGYRLFPGRRRPQQLPVRAAMSHDGG